MRSGTFSSGHGWATIDAVYSQGSATPLEKDIALLAGLGLLAPLGAVDRVTGRTVTLTREMCRFGHCDSVFKHAGFGGPAGKSVITRVRFRLPRPWRPVLAYLELEGHMQETRAKRPDAPPAYCRDRI